MGDKLFEQVFNLKLTAKQLNRSAVKCEKDEKAERLKVKKAIEKGNTEGAKIYAEVRRFCAGHFSCAATAAAAVFVCCMCSDRRVCVQTAKGLPPTTSPTTH